MRDLIGYPDSTVRGAVERLGIDTGVIRSPEDLQQLRTAQVTLPNTSNVTVLVISKAVKLLKHYLVFGDTVAAIKAIRTDPPPEILNPEWPLQRQVSHAGSPAASGPSGVPPRSTTINARPATSGPAIGSLRWGTSATAPAETPRPRTYVFPATMPRTVLTTSQETELYGLDKARMSAALREEVRAFKEWSSAPINTLRTNTYATASSSATLDKVGACVRAYLGYVAKYYHVPASSLALAEYLDPARIMHFVAYLNARRAQKGHILNHLSIAKKINVYLASGLTEEAPERTHAYAIDAWLGTLIHQYNLSERNPVKTNFPEATTLWAWADRISDLALFSINLDLQDSGQMSPVSAQFAQEAIVVSLVTGREVSPFRLDFLKTVRHPRHNDHAPCSDKDCRDPLNCIGNRVELRTPRSKVRPLRICVLCLLINV